MGGARIALVFMASALPAQNVQAILTIAGRVVVDRIGEAAHLTFLDDQRFLIVRDILPDIADQVMVFVARFEVLARLAAVCASAFSVVVSAQGLLVGDFLEFFIHRMILLKIQFVNAASPCLCAGGCRITPYFLIGISSGRGKYSAQHGTPQQHGNSPHYTGLKMDSERI